MNEKLRQARIEQRWSVEEASRHIGVGRITYVRWEQGIQIPRDSSLMLACKAFNRSPEQLGFEIERANTVPLEQGRSEATKEDKPSSQEQAALPEQVAFLISFSEAALQAGQGLEGTAIMAFDPSKRETLQKIAFSLLAGIGFSQIEPFSLLHMAQQGWLTMKDRTSSPSLLMDEETFAHVEQLIAHCWQLSRGKQQQIATAKILTGCCLPTLTDAARQVSPRQQQTADLVAQWYRLCAILGYHTESLPVAESHARNAVIYSKIAANSDLIVASLALHALVFYYANRPEQALEKCLEAEQYVSQTTYAVQSFLYRRKAACLAQLRQDKQALMTLDLAYQTFQQHPVNEVPLSYAEHNTFEMLLWEGITRSQIDQQDEAIATFEQLYPRKPAITFPERIRTGFLNNLLFAELRKSAQKRDMELCLTIWQEAAESAISLQSELRYDEVMHAYEKLLIAFPGEARLKELRPIMQRWQ